MSKFAFNPIGKPFDLVNPSPDLSAYLKLDQTTPQTVTNQPIVTAVDADYVWINDTSDSGKLKKALKSDFAGGGSQTPWTSDINGAGYSLYGLGYLSATKGILSNGTTDGYTMPTGSGTRFMWVPSKGSILAGIAGSTAWNYANIPTRATIFGNNNTTGDYGIVAGSTNVGGVSSAVFGSSNIGGGYTIVGGAGNTIQSQGSFGSGTNNYSVLGVSSANVSGNYVGNWAMGGFGHGYNESNTLANFTTGDTLGIYTKYVPIAIGYASTQGLINGVTINTVGSGYTNGDTVNIIDGVGGGLQGTAVLTVSGGTVTAVAIGNSGNGKYVAGAYSTTGGTGSGFKVNVTVNIIGIHAYGTGSISMGQDVSSVSGDNIINFGKSFVQNNPNSFNVSFDTYTGSPIFSVSGASGGQVNIFADYGLGISNNTYGDGFFGVSPFYGSWYIGDQAGDVNNTYLAGDDVAQAITSNAFNGWYHNGDLIMDGLGISRQIRTQPNNGGSPNNLAINAGVGTFQYDTGGNLSVSAGGNTYWGSNGARIDLYGNTGASGGGINILAASGSSASPAGGISLYSGYDNDSVVVGSSLVINPPGGYSGGDINLNLAASSGYGAGHGGNFAVNAGNGGSGGNGAYFSVKGADSSGNGGDIIIQSGTGATTGYIYLNNIPTSAGGPTGTIWVDTTGGLNILKVN